MRKIFVFWFGNEMSKNRQLALDSIYKNSGVEVIKITEKNVYDYSVLTDRIHPGFEYLSSTHKSAYLRPYFMKHYGGGYTDIKIVEFDWNTYFNMLEQTDKDFIGYQEIGPREISDLIPHAQSDWGKICGCGHYIFKPNTIFANVWYAKIKNKMKSIYNELKKNPGTYHPRAVTGGYINDQNKTVIDRIKYGNYPLGWGTEFGVLLHTTMHENMSRYIIGMPPCNGHLSGKEYR